MRASPAWLNAGRKAKASPGPGHGGAPSLCPAGREGGRAVSGAGGRAGWAPREAGRRRCRRSRSGTLPGPAMRSLQDPRRSRGGGREGGRSRPGAPPTAASPMGRQRLSPGALPAALLLLRVSGDGARGGRGEARGTCAAREGAPGYPIPGTGGDPCPEAVGVCSPPPPLDLN